MKVVTFYSFRGGVGRSLAVANVAHAMVKSGERRVLAVDLDLEAPGLSFMEFLQPEKSARKGGAFEFMRAYQARGAPDLADYIAPVKEVGDRLHFMTAGDLRRGYDVSALDIERLLSPKRRRGNFVDHFRAQAQSLGFHYVLVDSRTGLTEIGGMCTVALPDMVVLITGLNRQNLEGTRWVLQNIRSRGRDPKEAIVVFSPLPDSEEDLKRSRMREAKVFLKVEQDPIFLSYHPRMALLEELFVTHWPGTRLAEAYTALGQKIFARNDEDVDTLVKRLAELYEYWPLPVMLEGRKGRRGVKLEVAQRLREDTERTIEEAKTLYPGSMRIIRGAGRAYEAVGRPAEAVGHLETYLSKAEGLQVEEDVALLRAAMRADDSRAISREIARLGSLLKESDARRDTSIDWFQLLARTPLMLDFRAVQAAEVRRGVAVPVLDFTVRLAKLLIRRLPKRKASLYSMLVLSELLLHYYEPDSGHPAKALRYARQAEKLEPGSNAYNMACALALMGRRRDALDVLRSLGDHELTSGDPRRDRDWERYWDDPEFKEIVEKASGRSSERE